MAKSQSSVRNKQNTDIKEPRRFKVIVHNDDFTLTELVVRVLRVIFFKPTAEAERLMLDAQRNGKAVVGIYTYDIAKSKVHKAMEMARSEGYPLRLTYQPE